MAEGVSPAQAREVLDAADRRTEDVMLSLRLAEGMAADRFTPVETARLKVLAADGLVVLDPSGRVTLTLRGRLLADHVVRTVLAD